MLILTADEMRTVDRVTVERFGVPSLDLMERAGAAVAKFVLREFPGFATVTVLCGKGNNGGDGFVAARLLRNAGRHVDVLLLGLPEELKGDAAAMYARMSIRPVIAVDEAALETEPVRVLLARAEMFLDAVVGTGFKPPLRGAAAGLAAKLAGLEAPVVAVDLPSGWDADSREGSGPGAYRADAVVTFTAPKLAHLFGNMTANTTGPIVVAAIGSPAEIVTSRTGLHWSGEAAEIARVRRVPDSNKGMYGHVLVIGGSRGKSGAPSMTSLASLRAGAGLVTAAVPGSILPLVASVALELMTVPLAEAGEGEIGTRNLDADFLKSLLRRKTVIAMGTGISGDPEAIEFVQGLVRQTEIPLVLDADGLNAFKGCADQLDGQRRTLVLTPHPGEMATLLGCTVKEVQADRESVARDFATKHHLTLVLKGWRTLIAHPDGSIAVNTTGNPGMAKGGSGDILTGIVAAMLAQYPDRVAEAVEAAVYLHGLAADFAVLQQNEHTLLASDTVAHLHEAFEYEPEEQGAYTWIQGMRGQLMREGASRNQNSQPEHSKAVIH